MFWKNKNVFVTGATGFIGANLVKKLVELRANVICLQRDFVKKSSLDILGLTDKVSVISGSVEDFDLVSRILNEYEIDAVFHLAAQALVGVANRSPLSTFESNIRGTYVLLEACRQNEIVKRIVVASSDKAYGIHSELPYHEDFALKGLYPYDVSKTCTDLLAQSFAHTYNVPVSIVRSANVYGKGDLNFSRIIPGTILSILNNENPVIRSDGTPVREFIFAEDIVGGYLLLAENIEKAKGEAFNFGTDKPVQMSELVNLILKLMKKDDELEPDILLNKKIKNEIDAQYLSSEKVEKIFDWSAQTTLEDGLAKTIEWYKTNNSLLNN